MYFRPDEMASLARFGPRAVVWRPLFELMERYDDSRSGLGWVNLPVDWQADTTALLMIHFFLFFYRQESQCSHIWKITTHRLLECARLCTTTERSLCA